ncbi:hypothetical protein BC937DRAFT_92047 [Endogone sp. FLAS-F59071]|nr:hypothetical protein BC937DRAFT_92047 [Endogone sp. FLAS-F59071]|eukprot:RUS15749.1 hypothetical protein BC937DRAFT_92047 [Endogone sp. FLAS-F59071]
MNIINHEGIILLEQPFVKVTPFTRPPYEQLKKTFRTSQKYYEKELLYLSSSMSVLVTKSDAEKVTPDDATKAIDAMVTRLQNLKRKVKLDYMKL